MSNFTCPHCGMTNIDCGKDGYKTPREIELEEELKEVSRIRDDNFAHAFGLKLAVKKIKKIASFTGSLTSDEKTSSIMSDILNICNSALNEDK